MEFDATNRTADDIRGMAMATIDEDTPRDWLRAAEAIDRMDDEDVLDGFADADFSIDQFIIDVMHWGA